METDTLDRDGKCIEMNAVNYLEYKGIGHILSQYLYIKYRFVGDDLDQVPPSYSAIKINGKRLSDRIRNGENIDLNSIKSRKISIYEIMCEEFQSESFPDVYIFI